MVRHIISNCPTNEKTKDSITGEYDNNKVRKVSKKLFSELYTGHYEVVKLINQYIK